MSRTCQGAIVACVVLGAAATAAAQAPLPLGKEAQGKVSSGTPAEYTLVAKTAGVLVAAVKGEGDLALLVADEDGQTLPEGTADRDMNGSEGTEMVSMLISEPGTYRVRVRLQGGNSSTFAINGSWLPFAPFASASADPDRRPSRAKPAKIGEAMEDSLDSSQGDHWDWFVMKPAQAGTLAIVTRRVGDEDVDLVLEVFVDGKYGEPAGRSDQDLQGNSANETVTVNVNANQTVHVKISTAFNRAAAKYRISSSLIP